MILRVRRSKTIQFKEWVLEIPVARCCNTKLCAVYWTEKHFAQMQAAPGDIAFRIPDETGSVPLSYRVYQETLKLFANIAGLGGEDFTPHSLRRGGCTYLTMCGISIEEIKARGDWATKTVYDYLKTPLQARILNDLRVAASLSVVDERSEQCLGAGPA